MLTIQSAFRVCALAAPLLLLAQCTEGPSTPAAPGPSQIEGRPCLDDIPDPKRSFALVHPLAGENVCEGSCELIQWNVVNACGEWVTKVEGWYDGTYHLLGERSMTQVFAWDVPAHGCACARLRVTVTDGLGVIGAQEVQVPIHKRHPNPPPIERD